jgi:hypothetical protein
MKRILLSLLVLALAGTLFAKDVQREDARILAKNAYFQKLNTYVGDIDMANVVITGEFTITTEGQETIHAFNFENHGYILIAANDAIEPVLGYSFSSQYNPYMDADNFNSFLASYGEHVNYLRENAIDASAAIAQQWSSLKTFNPEGFAPDKSGKNVAPLLSCTWDQDNPYNFFCPPRTSQPSSNGKALVGCVATAMSQIMYYWRYPYTGEGDNTYWEPELLDYISADFSTAYYNWEGMVDNVNSLNIEVAEIGFHAGVSVNMDYYSPGGSGAYSFNVDDALKDHFQFPAQVSYKQRSSYPLTTWQGMVDDDLNDNIPVYYSGYSNDGGHAFVCDGLNEGDNTYHFNFGWSGYGNGYFALTNAGGYNQDQQMVHNIVPGDPNYPYGCELGTVITPLMGSIVDGSGPQQDYDANANGSWLIDPQTEQDSVTSITVHFTHLVTDEDDYITIYDGETTDAPVLGTYSGIIPPADYLTSTGNKMLITFETDGDSDTGEGWKIEFDTDQPTWCTSSPIIYTEPTGTITDGSGDFWYNGNSQCMFKIEPEYAIGCWLTFTEFDIEAENDVLKVYDGGNNSLLAELSGNEIPDPFFVESGKFFLLFQSNGAINGPGWSADWEVGNVGIQTTTYKGVSIFPNPANTELNLSFTTEGEESFTIELMSATGQVVYTINESGFNGKYTKQIDVSELSKGVYFLNIKGTTANVIKKVMVK